MFKVGVCIRHKTLATLTTLTSRLISSQVQRGVDHNRWPAHDNQGRIRTERQAALWSPPSDQIARDPPPPVFSPVGLLRPSSASAPLLLRSPPSQPAAAPRRSRRRLPFARNYRCCCCGGGSCGSRSIGRHSQSAAHCACSVRSP